MKPPRIITRSEWGARPYRGTCRRLRNIDALVIHHAAAHYARTLEDGKAQVRSIQRFHQHGRRWSDVGYHFLVDGGGHIYQGRRYEEAKPLEALPKLALGAHVRRQNSGKIGICVLGCYHPPADNCDDPLSERSLQAVMRLSAFLCQAYDVPPARIYGHRDFLRTACPGDVLFRKLAKLRSGAIRAIQSGA
ncbi:MAG: N-acetylmuramoyl-L-alanine amidase [Gammaproteobacteria bacterium]